MAVKEEAGTNSNKINDSKLRRSSSQSQNARLCPDSQGKESACAQGALAKRDTLSASQAKTCASAVQTMFEIFAGVLRRSSQAYLSPQATAIDIVNWLKDSQRIKALTSWQLERAHRLAASGKPRVICYTFGPAIELAFPHLIHNLILYIVAGRNDGIVIRQDGLEWY